MKPIPAARARKKLSELIDTVNKSHEPVLITGKRGKAVLIAEEDWRAITETLYLNAIPGMADSIGKGIQTDSADCTATPAWR